MKNPIKSYLKRQERNHVRKYSENAFRYEILPEKKAIAILCDGTCIEYVDISITMTELLAVIGKYKEQAARYIRDTYGEED